ncbi:MAG: SH3 domain-containing protein [Clostridia bacterium]|nr:SH3 domain-containing protein [Clostridia bacterium]
MKKRKIIILVAVVILLVSIGVVVAFISGIENDYHPTEPLYTEKNAQTDRKEPEETVEVHSHNYLSVVTTPPMCMEKGVRTLTCSCGDSYTEEMEAKGHTWSEATCITPKTCKDCGAKDAITGITIPTSDYVNVRSNASVGSDILTSIPPQTPFNILGQTNATDGYVWYKVSYGGFEGYVRSDLITVTSLAPHKGGTATCSAKARCTVCGNEYGDKADHDLVEATCQEAKHCKNCNYKAGTVVAHSYTPATCVSPKTCKYCGKTEGTPGTHSGGIATCMSKARCVGCGNEYGELGVHSYVFATCTQPKHCRLCNYTEGGLAPHAFMPATCLSPKKCSNCGLTEGSAGSHSGGVATCIAKARCSSCGNEYGNLGTHSLVSATCTTPKHCSICDYTEGTVTAHNFNPATCTTPRKCTGCGLTEGTVVQHSFYSATCTSPSQCKWCGLTDGSPLPHDFAPATCTSPEMCRNCGLTQGGAGSHSYSGGTCTKCGAKDPNNPVYKVMTGSLPTPGLNFSVLDYSTSVSGNTVYVTMKVRRKNSGAKYLSVEIYTQSFEKLCSKYVTVPTGDAWTDCTMSVTFEGGYIPGYNSYYIFFSG